MANTAIIDLAKPAGTDHALISVINSNMDKIDAEAGRQRGNFAGTYSTTSGYAVGDYCIYQGNLYRCTTAIGSSGENWTAGHWTSVKVGTELKGLSDQIANHVSCSTHSKSSLSTTAGTALVVDDLTTYIPTGKQFMGLSKIMCSGGNATDYGVIQLNSAGDKIIYMPTVTQSSVTLQFSIFYK